MSLDPFTENRFETEASPDRAVPPAATIARLVGEGKFCAAARLYSDTTGADLIESKLAIDRLARRHGIAPNVGCASYLGVMVAAGGAGVLVLARMLS